MGSGERGGGGAFAVGSDQVGDVVLIEAVAQALRFTLGWTHRAGESHGVTKSHVSGLRRVRVSGKYLHREGPGRWSGPSCLSGVRVPILLPLRKRRSGGPGQPVVVGP